MTWFLSNCDTSDSNDAIFKPLCLHFLNVYGDVPLKAIPDHITRLFKTSTVDLIGADGRKWYLMGINGIHMLILI